MGREVRRVPAGWEHPRDERGHYRPLHDEAYEDVARRWITDAIAWNNGSHEILLKEPERKEEYPFFWQWDGDPPDPDYYRPAFESEPTHFQMYENVSEGTPVSPIFATQEELVRWLVDTDGVNEADARQFVEDEYAPSLIIGPGVGVEYGYRAASRFRGDG